MTLDWTRFKELEGAVDRNFELFVRAIVSKQWERHGVLRSRRNQPGIEFHLELHSDCSLGKAGEWFGWQCKWYELGQSHSLGVKRRAEIAEAVAKAKADVPGMTDFVLCLQALPRKSDILWFDELGVTSGVRVRLWADEALEAHLNGDAAIDQWPSAANEVVFTSHAASTTRNIHA